MFHSHLTLLIVLSYVELYIEGLVEFQIVKKAPYSLKLSNRLAAVSRELFRQRLSH
jgi:hypothetical protein